MKCPICGAENKPGARNCKCGFFLVLQNEQVEVEASSQKFSQLKTDKAKYSKALFMGMVWTVIGVILSITIYIMPGLPQDYRVKFVFLGIVVIVYGLYEIVRCQIKIRKIVKALSRVGSKRLI